MAKPNFGERVTSNHGSVIRGDPSTCAAASLEVTLNFFFYPSTHPSRKHTHTHTHTHPRTHATHVYTGSPTAAGLITASDGEVQERECSLVREKECEIIPHYCFRRGGTTRTERGTTRFFLKKRFLKVQLGPSGGLPSASCRLRRRRTSRSSIAQRLLPPTCLAPGR